MGFPDLVATVDENTLTHLGGVAVSYAPLSGTAVALTGMFDANYVKTDAADIGRESVGPSVFLSAAELAKLAVHPDNDTPTLTIESVAYKMRESGPDSLGGLRLYLFKATVP